MNRFWICKPFSSFLMFRILPLQDSHPRDNYAAERREEIQLAQIENSGCGSPTKPLREEIRDDERGSGKQTWIWLFKLRSILQTLAVAHILVRCIHYISILFCHLRYICTSWTFATRPSTSSPGPSWAFRTVRSKGWVMKLCRALAAEILHAGSSEAILRALFSLYFIYLYESYDFDPCFVPSLRSFWDVWIRNVYICIYT